MSTEQLKSEIVAFVRDYSIEATPHDAERLDSFKGVLQPGTDVYMAHPPGIALDEIVRLSGRLKQLGVTPVPHIIARKLESRAQLESALAKLRELGVDRALVVAGDIAVANHAFDSSLEVLETGLFQKHGFKAVGVAG